MFPSYLSVFLKMLSQLSQSYQYYHEYLDMILFFKTINGLLNINPNIIPQVQKTRSTRSFTRAICQKYIIRKCKTSTFQKSYFNRSSRVWNTLASSSEHFSTNNLSFFRKSLLSYYFNALSLNYDPDDPRSWKTICLTCNKSRSLTSTVSCCF